MVHGTHDPRFPFKAADRFELPGCKDCDKLEAKALAKGRDPRKALCGTHAGLRNLPEPMLGIRVGFERVNLDRTGGQ